MTKNFHVVYRPWITSDLTSTLILAAHDEADAEEIFKRMFPNWIFVKATVDQVM